MDSSLARGLVFVDAPANRGLDRLVLKGSSPERLKTAHANGLPCLDFDLDRTRGAPVETCVVSGDFRMDQTQGSAVFLLVRKVEPMLSGSLLFGDTRRRMRSVAFQRINMSAYASRSRRAAHASANEAKRAARAAI